MTFKKLVEFQVNPVALVTSLRDKKFFKKRTGGEQIILILLKLGRNDYSFQKLVLLHVKWLSVYIVSIYLFCTSMEIHSSFDVSNEVAFSQFSIMLVSVPIFFVAELQNLNSLPSRKGTACSFQPAKAHCIKLSNTSVYLSCRLLTARIDYRFPNFR